ncbi:hypothetical protein F4802DRAFT_138340 [Xylaria palmicola]|nr:hypothetical protein F4802DRAFT_138340 [Xylaria palmicola]
MIGTMDGSVSSSNDRPADGGEGPSSLFASSNNPQAAVSGGLSIARPTALPLSAISTVAQANPIAAPRSSVKSHATSSLLRGPTPQKGSGQDRFRQFLEGNSCSGVTTVVPHSTFAIPPSTIQRSITAQHYSPILKATDPPLLSFHSAASTSPGEETDRSPATPSDITAEMPQAVKAGLKGASLKNSKPATRKPQTVGVEANAQNHPVATARLSAQCQLRHFNPKWHETSGPDGFKCSVQLINKFICCGHVYPTASEAKQAVAEKALVYVCRLPCHDPPQRVAARVKASEKTDRFNDRNQFQQAQGKRESAGHSAFHDQYTYVTPAGTPTVAYNWNAYNPSEQGTLLHRIQSILGGAGPSPAVLSDPLAVQAFLQGLAVGTSVRTATSVYDAYLEPRGRPLAARSSEIYRPYAARERSPVPNFGQNYRDRSPAHQRTAYEPNTQRFN